MKAEGGQGSPAVGRAVLPDNEAIFSWIEDLAAFEGRGTQTLEDHRSSDYLVTAMSALGLTDVQVQETESLHWNATHSTFEVAGREIPHTPVAFSFDSAGDEFSTGAQGLTAAVVDVGDGAESDFARTSATGNFVMFNLRFLMPRSVLLELGDFFYDPKGTTDESVLTTANPYVNNYEEVVERAISRGAVGFIGVLADYFDSHEIRPEFMPGISIPGIWVTKRIGEHLRERFNPGVPTATLHLHGSRRPTTARTVIGYLPGRSTDTIMVQSHHDSAWAGGVEDASGTAEVLALASYYSQLTIETRPKTLMFVHMDSHWTGYQAHQHFVRTFVDAQPTDQRIVANVTLEHIAKQAEIGPSGELLVLNQPEYRGIFENVSKPLKAAIEAAVARHDLERTIRLATDRILPLLGELPTDADFVYRAGIPCISFISGPLYLYDRADTVDKVYKDGLADVAAAFVDIIDHLAETPSDQIRAEARLQFALNEQD